jgi:hypothetical protein
MVQLGEKHECDDCGIKVYDLGRPEAVCPRCGRDLKSTAPKRRVEEAPPRARAVPEPVIEEPPEETPDAEDLDDDLAADDELELVEGESPEAEVEEAEADDDE